MIRISRKGCIVGVISLLRCALNQGWTGLSSSHLIKRVFNLSQSILPERADRCSIGFADDAERAVGD